MRLATALFLLSAAPAFAGEAWDEIRPELYGDREIKAAGSIVSLDIPYRATDDREVPVAASVRLDGADTVKTLSIIIDDNPMPVSAVFELDAPERDFAVAAQMRINGPTPVRAVVETQGGDLYMAEGYVKTSGLGACAAPPVTNPEVALASLGAMKLRAAKILGTAETPASPLAKLTAKAADASVSSRPEPTRVRLEMQHPSHSGMQMDQITLLYILARYVETVEVWTDDDKLFTMTGSISLSEDPEIEFSFDAPAVERLRVRMTDTEGAEFEEVFPLGES